MEKLENTIEALRALFPQPEPPEQIAEAAEGEGEKEAPVRGPGFVETDYEKHGSHLDVLCEPDQIVAVATIIDEQDFFLESISGVDWLKDNKLEVIYDFSRFQETCRVTVRTFIPRDKPEISTITSVTPAANWHERETFDFYGIIFQGHPDLTRILLPEDADFHPLLKDYMP